MSGRLAASMIAHRRRRELLDGGGGGGGVAVLNGSEWRTGTGKSEASIRDTSNGLNPWPAYNGTLGNNAAEIVAPDAGLTTRGNYYRIYNDGTNNMTVRNDTVLPAEFTSHYGRVYLRNNKTVGAHNHPIALGGLGGGSIVLVPSVVTGTASGTQIQVQTLWKVDGSASGYRRTRWTPGVQGVGGQNTLTDNQWYLKEWYVEWLSSTRYQFYTWISEVDSTGAITNADIYTAATFFWEDYFGVADGNLAATQISDTTMSGISTLGGQTRQYVLGNEGPGGGSTNGEHFDYASFGLSTAGRLRDQSLGLG